jgi:hemerythrin superfamily protein
MLRDKNLISFSHQHQHALALCVRIERALQHSEVDMLEWEEEIVRMFDTELELHFESEERYVFPSVARFDEMRELLERLNSDHTRLRVQGMEARQHQLDREGLERFARVLSDHVRAEERLLFEQMQQKLSPTELERIGTSTNGFLKERST